jgi:hypothetical protein
MTKPMIHMVKIQILTYNTNLKPLVSSRKEIAACLSIISEVNRNRSLPTSSLTGRRTGTISFQSGDSIEKTRLTSGIITYIFH